MSHFCEKACWALNFHGIEHDIKLIPVGLHVFKAKRLGVPSTTVPILVVDEQVIQGSDQIIDWAESRSESKTLIPNGDIDRCLEIEKRLDDIAGVHVRRYFYSESLVEHSSSVRQAYLNDSTLFHKVFIYATWSGIRKFMIKVMDLGKEQGVQSKDIIDGELDWLDGLLSDGRKYLVGDRFSRADLTAASLLAPIVIPKEHPVYNGVELPPRMTSDIEAWKARPSIKWVHDIYSKYR